MLHMMSRPTEYLTVRNVAELLKVHEETVRRWIRTGQLHATRTPGGQLRIDPAQFDDHTVAS